MTSPLPARRQLLEDLIEHAALDDVDLATMFGSPAIRHRGRIVCFLGADDRLIVKLTRPDTFELVERGDADPVVMGNRTLREWVSVPRESPDTAALERWRPLVVAALGYARAARAESMSGPEESSPEST
ncbi:MULTISPECIES: hypothetical protein [unclassified Rathayibacter]|uniref:hypothetical protein n=1 Tax=unclassified Rathayibacter TaxID=2609250 RepID=UPI00104F3A95|nr:MULTISPECIES: hypothetical protein [unclassified Rathayibacter]TCL81746.1 hypothetical protein EDF49_107103 [Rathayibacter sp. PhB192]TCM26755.1 hypothetical protein EDF43_107103 [Rathayibacter sp. PhB179]